MNTVIWQIGQGIILLLLAPLVNGVIKKAKAKIQKRKGPPLLQGYRDILKFLRREAVTSVNTSWITTVTPYIVLSAYLTAGSLIPLLTRQEFIISDIIVLVYLFALARFFMALAALEPASAFGGMGASREMMIASLVEPVFVLGLFGMVAFAGSTDLGLLAGAGRTPSGMASFIGLMLVTVAETGRIPVDNPDTHLELTMVHEGMLLEYSGRQLGLLHLAAMLKQVILLALLVHLFLPVSGISMGLGLVLLLIRITVLALALALIESITVKMRLFRLPELMVGGAVFCLISIVLQSFN